MWWKVNSFLSVLILVLSCGPAEVRYAEDGVPLLRYAKKFDLSKNEGMFRLQLPDGSLFWFTDESYAKTNGSKDSIIRVPIQKLACSTTTQLSWFTAVGAAAVVAGFPDVGLVYDAALRRRIKEGFIEDVSGPSSFSDELMIELSPDLILADQSIRVSGRLTERYPVIVTSESTESHPLGRAEWIKLGGLLAGKYGEADSVFKAVEHRYLSLAVDSAANNPGPEVLTGVPYGGTWFLPGEGSFMSKLLRDAGFRLSWPVSKGAQQPTALEQVMAGSGNVTYWIGVGAYRTIRELLASDSRLGKIPAVRMGNVFTYMPTDSNLRGNPYFEEAVIRPDLLLEDLVQIKKGKADGLHYFRRLPMN